MIDNDTRDDDLIAHQPAAGGRKKRLAGAVALLLAGGIGSGLFDRNNQPIKLYYDVSSQVLLLFPAINGGAGGGSYFLNTDVTKATAFIQSLSPRGFDESLMSYIIFAANEETRTGRIRTGISTMDDSSKPSCN